MFRNDKTMINFGTQFKFKKHSFLMALGACALFISGCAATQDHSSVMDPVDAIYDPLESTNRAVFAFNTAVDDTIIHPVVKGYRAIIPAAPRKGVSNFLTNLKSPVILANQILQGDLDGAGTVLFRTTVNTLAGFGGILDVAGWEGIEHESEDFGQTLAVWGVDHGPYIVVPIIGPSSARDYVGFLVDGFADPLRWYLFNTEREALFYTKTGIQYLSIRDELMDVLEDLEASSIDYYAATRSIYYQHRAALVNDENPALSNAPAIPDYDE